MAMLTVTQKRAPMRQQRNGHRQTPGIHLTWNSMWRHGHRACKVRKVYFVRKSLLFLRGAHNSPTSRPSYSNIRGVQHRSGRLVTASGSSGIV
jgi:hypothetical protein